MPHRRSIKNGFMVIQGPPGNLGDSKFYETEEEADFEAKRILERDDKSSEPVIVVQVTRYSRNQKAV